MCLFIYLFDHQNYGPEELKNQSLTKYIYTQKKKEIEREKREANSSKPIKTDKHNNYNKMNKY